MDLVVDNGKVIEPTFGKKVVAKIMRDDKAVMVLTQQDVQQMVVNKMWRDNDWLKRYTHSQMLYDIDSGEFTITFIMEE